MELSEIMIWRVFCEISALSGQGSEKRAEKDQRARKMFLCRESETRGFVSPEREVNCKAKAC